MKFDVCNRWSGKIQFTAEIDCAAGERPSVQMGLAARWAIANGASLVGASLDGARLDGASLRSNVGTVYELGAGQSFCFLGRPDNWHAITFVARQGEQRVFVGCRDFTVAEAAE